MRGRTVTRPCEWCGKMVTRRVCDLKNGHVYCSHSCSNHASSERRTAKRRARIEARVRTILGRGRWVPTTEVAARLGHTTHSIGSTLRRMEQAGELIADRAGPGESHARPTYWLRPRVRGRVCAHPGCGTILSIYNPDDYCALHAPEHLSLEDMEATG